MDIVEGVLKRQLDEPTLSVEDSHSLIGISSIVLDLEEIKTALPDKHRTGVGSKVVKRWKIIE